MTVPAEPSYPIMFIATQNESIEIALLCCCGQVFDEQISDSCPNCHGVNGMTATQHAIALTEIQLHLCELQSGSKVNMASCAGWIKWELSRLDRLIVHANGAANTRIPTQEKIDRLVHALQQGGPAAASAICAKEHQEDECRAQWMETGPFKMFPPGHFIPRDDHSA